MSKNENLKQLQHNFFAICYDCLYYGYFEKFIFNQYQDIIQAIGVEKAKEIYKQALNKICNE